MEHSVENLCDFLHRSRLLSPDDAKAVLGRWQESAKEKATSASHFTRWLVREQIVTEYQASLLAKGMIDDFFLGKYRILERVGRGRMAGVYRAAAPDGKIVALKVLPPSRARIPSLLARFQREAKLSLRFDHPNVVRTLEVGEANGLHYLVMEFIVGETADETLTRRKTLYPREAAAVLLQALRGLQHLHEAGIVHRDLKPANLMLLGGGERTVEKVAGGCLVKILDIGLARPLFEDTADKPSERSDGDRPEPSELTQEGVLLGTPDYLSPEQARDPRTIDVRSDIYSLGCVFYHLLVGQPPFPDGNVLNQMVRHATETPRPLREIDPTLPESLQQILNYMLAKSPDQRYPTPARAAEAIQAYLDETQTPSTSSARSSSTEAPRPLPEVADAKRKRPADASGPRPTGGVPVARAHAPPPPERIPPVNTSADVELVLFDNEPVVRPAASDANAATDWILYAIVAGVGVLVAAIVGVVFLISRS